MPSVHTNYEGRLTNPRSQDRLARRICEIGEALSSALKATCHPVDVTLPWPVLVRVPGTETDFAEIGDVHVVGAEMTLEDFRGDRHRFPFTFIRDIGRNHLALPDLGGTLVTIEDHEECRLYVAPRIQKAQCYLPPYATQLLRYDLEPEFDLLLGYVRVFHWPTVRYWRWTSQPRCAQYREWATALRARSGPRRTIADAVERWREVSGWTSPTEWSTCRISDEARARLDAEGTAEAIATGVLIDLLSCAGR